MHGWHDERGIFGRSCTRDLGAVNSRVNLGGRVRCFLGSGSKFLNKCFRKILLLAPKVYKIQYFLGMLRAVRKGSSELNDVWNSRF